METHRNDIHLEMRKRKDIWDMVIIAMQIMEKEMVERGSTIIILVVITVVVTII